MIQKRGIALLITMIFIIAITVAIGVGLKQINVASQSVEREAFIIETSMILDDVLRVLESSKELDLILKGDDEDIKREAFYIFLSQVAFIPFESSGIKMSLEISSARSKFNPNGVFDINSTANTNEDHFQRVEALISYLNFYEINAEYVNILVDMISGVKEDMSYNSDIFNQQPYLFRDYIVSEKHLDEINSFYMKTYRENKLKNINFKNLFYYSKDKERYKIDLNYATVEVWQLLLGCDQIRAQQLSDEAGAYSKLEDLVLSDDENLSLARFKTSYFEPILDVKVEIMKDELNTQIKFEYDMQTKKGSNFVYEI
ncbi:MAG: hypothetical protein U9P38_06710 [Campylobacterota bacterium]|nr:hypothetical protein [Campylobacterota bacterium]